MQLEALSQAQSIVYLSIFIVQCFNVSLPVRKSLMVDELIVNVQVFAVKAKFSYPCSYPGF
jgi:hypothetical protein